jgi:hypothetical protein
MLKITLSKIDHPKLRAFFSLFQNDPFDRSIFLPFKKFSLSP